MAKIWPVYEGREPTIGDPWAELPVSAAIPLCELKPNDFVSDLTATPRFGDVDRSFLYRGYKHIVVEIEQAESRQAKWKPGYYRSPVKPEDVFWRLAQRAIAVELGDENVLRVEHEPATDSQGNDALKITVVIAPGATKKLAKGASLSALIQLQVRLSAMRENRTPIIDYATEAELVEDGGP